MYKIPKLINTSLDVNDSVEGEFLETKIERMLNNGDEMAEGKELIYTRPEDGVIGDFNIRHDHWNDAYEQSSIIAERRGELDSKQLEKRRKLLQEEKEEQKHLKEVAKEGLKAKQEARKGQSKGSEGAV